MTRFRLSHTRLSVYRQCPKRYWWTYIENLVPKTTLRVLEIGANMHTALGLHFEQKEPQALEAIHDDPEVTGLYRDYLLQYPKEEEFEVIATEHFTEAQLDFDYDVWYAVKADNIIRFRKLLFLFEHKTCGRLGPTDIRRYLQSPQIKGYIWGMNHVLKTKIHGCLWDFIIKTKHTEFQRIPQLYNESELEEWRQITLKWALEISTAEDLNEFTEDLSACYGMRGECPYTPICIKKGGEEVKQSLFQTREEQNPLHPKGG